MLAHYELRVFTSYGIPVAEGITDIFALSFSRSRNNVGAFEVTLPPHYTEDTFGEDYVVEIWRSIDGRSFALIDDTCWFVREIEYDLDSNGKELLYVRGHDTTGLLERRIVAWYSFGSAAPGANAPSYKTAPADRAIYEVWQENFGSLVEGTLADSFNTPPPSVTAAEGWNDPGITLDALLRLMPRSPTGPIPDIPIGDAGALVSGVEIAWGSALDAMRQIADAAQTLGTLIWFDILYETSDNATLGTFSFRVWVGNRGADLSQTVVLSPYFDTMATAKIRKTYTELANWIHVGGPGQGDLRLVGGLVDDTSVLKSAFYPIEAFVDASESFSEESLLSAAQAELYHRRAKTIISGEIRQSPEFRFGRDYRYGTIVSVFYRNVQASSAIEAYSVEVADGIETIDIPLEGTVP